MIGKDCFSLLQDVVEFARHVPLKQIARRIQLAVRRRLLDLTLFHRPLHIQISCSCAPPLPILPPRPGLALIDEGRISFCFLNARAGTSLEGFDWCLCAETSSTQLWRMNLHYMEYLEDLPTAVCFDLMASWLAHNYPKRRGSWRDAWNSYALSLRVVVWMQQLALRGSSIDKMQRRALDLGVAQQLQFLEANLETDIGGNHLVKNVKALIWGSAYFTGDAAERWRKKGVTLLEEILERQILADGAHYERSPSYHCQVFADLLEIRNVLGPNSVHGRLDTVLARMARFTMDMMHPDGAIAQFNDAGLAMAYEPKSCLSAYGRLFGVSPAQRRHFVFQEAGYFGFKTNSLYVVGDFGRLAPDDLPAHGHGDIGSFELSLDERRIFVDQGVFEYVPGELRRSSRTAACHNTLFIEGGDQASFFGAFRIGRRPNVELGVVHVSDSRVVIEGTHNGFANLPGSPIHLRRFDITPDRAVILDQIKGHCLSRARLSFLLHPDVRFEAAGSKIEIFSGARSLVMTVPAPIVIEKAEWWPDMGVRIPTRRICVIIPDGWKEAVTTLDFR